LRKNVFILALFAILFSRLVLLEIPGLIDPTEGRYAFIAQEMFLTGDWTTPKVPLENTVTPYLGKPPLHFWLTAFSFKLFGMDEWSARLPSFLSLLLICFAVWKIGFGLLPAEKRLLPPFIAASSVFGFIASGTVIIDLSLTAAISICMMSFICAKDDPSIRWRILFVISLAAVILAKGPIGVVLIGIPIIISSPLRGLISRTWILLGILGGLIACSWFALVELQNPGFIKYFLFNENLGRFFLDDYGDKYGSGHQHIWGMSWVMFAVGFVPWTPFLFFLLYKKRIELWNDQYLRFLAIWTFSSVVLFSAARQLHPGYILPALPGAAILMAYLLPTSLLTNLRIGFGTVMVMILGLIIYSEFYDSSQSTNQILDCITKNSDDQEATVAVSGNGNYSALFYERAWAREFTKPIKLQFNESINLAQTLPNDLLLRKSEVNNLSAEVLASYHQVTKKSRWVWLRKNSIQLKFPDCSS
jgi:4-amino-4-deoxy-L-arabinose transferase-like glycosyltransferase